MPHSVHAEDGLGFYRDLDGFLITCGLDLYDGLYSQQTNICDKTARNPLENPRSDGDRHVLALCAGA
jgi:hypothetical protein